MLKAALFSDGTREYRIPEEPECGEEPEGETTWTF